ncbi:MAG: hypothetical protein CL946_01545 [Ectothiorhodospiraceae bacterium]|nr:hypothetical protein [Ectothiorhodospiraceae bacterium]
MGSQQLLLIVLGVIIVGIAVVVGISIFGSNADQANKDAVTQDILRMASQAQGYYRKPTMLGGGGNSFSGLDLQDLGFSTASSGINANGSYAVSAATASTATLVGSSSTVASATVQITVSPDAVSSPTYSGY